MNYNNVCDKGMLNNNLAYSFYMNKLNNDRDAGHVGDTMILYAWGRRAPAFDRNRVIDDVREYVHGILS
ncbi:MAG TPA: hypothetical protein VK436_11370 [Methanocella sp.]|nr:hypothetical protein [Methanocella sp.]